MHYTIELLVKGDSNVVTYYKNAVARWRDIWSRPEARDLVELATLLSDEETWFEQNCGSPLVGQEIMVVSGFGMLQTTGSDFDRKDRLALLYDAFQQSYCSLDVKCISREVAMSYNLFEERVA